MAEGLDGKKSKSREQGIRENKFKSERSLKTIQGRREGKTVDSERVSAV
jgi:hypothetical protein